MPQQTSKIHQQINSRNQGLLLQKFLSWHQQLQQLQQKSLHSHQYRHIQIRLSIFVGFSFSVVKLQNEDTLNNKTFLKYITDDQLSKAYLCYI